MKPALHQYSLKDLPQLVHFRLSTEQRSRERKGEREEEERERERDAERSCVEGVMQTTGDAARCLGRGPGILVMINWTAATDSGTDSY